MAGDEVAHHFDALLVIDNREIDAGGAQPFLGTEERGVFRNHDFRNFVEKRRSAAHGARRERGVKRAVAVNGGGLTSGVLKRTHLAMEQGVTFLYAHVVSTSDDFALMDDHGTDRNTALGESQPGFINRRLEKWVAHTSSNLAVRAPHDKLAAGQRALNK